MPGNVVLEMSGDDAKLFRSLAKMESKVAELEGKLREAGNTGQKSGEKVAAGFDKAGESTGKAFGKKAIDGLAGYVSGIASVTAAVGVLKKGFEEAGAAAEGAGKRVSAAFPAMTRLLQVAGTPERYAALAGEVSKLRTSAGIGQDAAAEAVFMAESAGLTKHMPTFARLGKIDMNLPASIAGVQKTLANFPSAGSPAEILNMLLAAGGKSPMAAQEMAKASMTSAAPWAAMGGTAEENLALTAVLTETFKSSDVAGERVGGLAGKVVGLRERGQMGLEDINVPYGARRSARFTNPKLLIINALRKLHGQGPLDIAGLKGRELVESLPGLGMVGALRGAGGETVGLVEWLGDQGAVQAMSAIGAQRGKISSTIANIAAAKAGTGGAGDLLGGMETTFNAQPELALELGARSAEQAQAITEEQRFGATEVLRRKAEAVTRRFQARGSEWSYIPRLATDALERGITYMTGSPYSQAASEVNLARGAEKAMTGKTIEGDALLAELRAIREGVDRTARNTQGPAAGRRPDEDK